MSSYAEYIYTASQKTEQDEERNTYTKEFT